MIYMYDEFVDCLFDWGVIVVWVILNLVDIDNVDGNWCMMIVCNVIKVVWLLLDV